MGWVDYSNWLPYILPAELPFVLNIDVGHILAQHGFTDNHCYLKSMFCLNLSYANALWWLIAHAFVTVCGGSYSRPINTHHRASSQCCDYAVVRYWYPFGISWLIQDRAARWLYLRYQYNGCTVFIHQTWPS